MHRDTACGARARARERGTTLIFVLGILALLSLFAITFANMTRLERTASANYMDNVRADLVARSGLNAGVSAVREAFRTPGLGGGWGANFNGGGFSNVPHYYPTGNTNSPVKGDNWYYTGNSYNITPDNAPSTGNGVPLLASALSQLNARPSLPLDISGGQSAVYNAAPSIFIPPLSNGSGEWSHTNFVSGIAGG